MEASTIEVTQPYEVEQNMDLRLIKLWSFRVSCEGFHSAQRWLQSEKRVIWDKEPCSTGQCASIFELIPASMSTGSPGFATEGLPVAIVS